MAKVLIVDDSPTEVHVLQTMLTKNGHDVVVATSGEDGVEMAEKEKPDLIIKAVNAVKDSKNKTKLLCGAGIVSGDDVSKAVELGSKGILVASGIIKAKDWNKIISEFAKALV